MSPSSKLAAEAVTVPALREYDEIDALLRSENPSIRCMLERIGIQKLRNLGSVSRLLSPLQMQVERSNNT